MVEKLNCCFLIINLKSNGLLFLLLSAIVCCLLWIFFAYTRFTLNYDSFNSSFLIQSLLLLFLPYCTGQKRCIFKGIHSWESDLMPLAMKLCLSMVVYFSLRKKSRTWSPNLVMELLFRTLSFPNRGWDAKTELP